MAKETYNPYGFIPANPDNSHVGYYPVAASQTIAKGDAVILSSGQVAIAVAASSTELLGIAAQASASQAANTLIAIYDDPATVFFGRTNADASSKTIGAEYDLAGTTGAMQVNVGASSQDLFVLLGTKTGDDNSETGAHLMVKINKHALADQS
jgi:hypothetical protein